MGLMRTFGSFVDKSFLLGMVSIALFSGSSRRNSSTRAGWWMSGQKMNQEKPRGAMKPPMIDSVCL
jgi:hypothetical protein